MKPFMLVCAFITFALAGCSGGAADRDGQISVTGVLAHFPPDRQSAEAWFGHEFKVGDKPVKASAAVPAEEMMKHVGKTVTVTGDWEPGREWKPSGQEMHLPRPSGVEMDGKIIRGDGIVAKKLTPAN